MTNRVHTSLRAKIALILCGLLLGFILVDVSFRALVAYSTLDQEAVTKHDGTVAMATTEDGWTRYDTLLGWSHIPNTTVTAPYEVQINSRGFRADREYITPKPQRVRRVIFTGCSYTFGHQVNTTETYVYRLDQALGPEVEVVNMGSNAYGIDQMLLWFERDGRALQPDLVIAAVIWNDFERADMSIWPSGYSKPRFVLSHGRMILTNVPPPERKAAGEPLLSSDSSSLWSTLFHRTRNTWKRRTQEPLRPKDFLGHVDLGERLETFPALYQEILLRFRDSVIETGARFAVLRIPFAAEKLNNPLYRRLNASLAAFLEDHDIPLIDLFDPLRKHPDPESLFRGHPTPEGHQVFADLILPALRTLLETPR